MSLAVETCQPCPSDALSLTREGVRQFARETPAWTVKGDSIERVFQFADFHQAMSFVNQVAEIANAEDHHPDIHIYYGMVRLELSTHKIGGLSRNDFVVAAKIDQLLEPR